MNKMLPTRLLPFLLLLVFSVVHFQLKAQSQIYFSNFSNPPASPATQTSSNATYATAALSGWTGYSAATYPAYVYTSSSSGTVTLTFASPLTLNSNGTERGKIIINWGATANRPLTIALNGGSAVQIDAVAVSADRNVVRNISYSIPDATTTLSSIKLASSGGSGVYWFNIEVKTYSSGVPPTVTTTAASPITTTTASAGGNVTAEGDAPVTAKGVVWATTSSPNVALATKTNDGAGLGVFTSAITSLTANTKYWDAAYATSTVATAYGAVDSFTTYSLAPVIAPASNISLTGYNANWTAPVQGAESFFYSLDYSTDNTFATGVTNVSSIPSSSTSQTLSGLTSGATYYYRVRILNSAGYSVYSATQSVVLADGTLSTDYFRSAASGNWNAAASWESSHNNSTWTAATSGPDNNASAIQIKSGHTLTVTAPATANNITVDLGGQLVINSGNTFTVANGTGTDITVNGTVKNIGTFTLAASATMTVGASGTYEDAQAATTGTITLPTATWTAGSTCSLTGLVGVAGTDYSLLQGVKQSFSNFKINTPNLITKLLLTKNGGTSAPYMDITGTLTVDATGSGTGVQILSSGNNNNTLVVGQYVQNGGNVQALHNASSAATRNFTVTGDFTLNNNSVFDAGNTTGTTATNITYVNVGGNVSVAPTATLQRTNQSATPGTVVTFIFNGTGAQTATFGLTAGPLNYTINNAAGVTLATNITVNGILTFTTGNITTGNNTVIISSTGSVVASASGWVAGNLQKNIATGATAATFEVGGPLNYRPVTVAFGNVTTAGDLKATVSQTAGDHPQIATSGINAAKSVNRFWTLTNSGVVFDNYSANFTFVAADVDAGANTANFSVRKYSGSAWSSTTTGTQTATSTQATGLTSFSDFAIGEVTPFSVALSNFRGEQAGTINKLLWNTATENNNKRFEIERSADGVRFTSVAFVATKADKGNSTSALGYNYDDERALAGNNYYRLKQIDNDGKYNYSNVVLLSRKVTDITLSALYPNPTKAELNVKIISPRAEKLTVIITDLTGKVIRQIAVNVIAGDNVKQLNVASLATGSYVVKAICANGCETARQQFIKQ
jgi:hypothetical protein